MKVGDKVQILGIFGEDKIDEKYVGLEGIIINIEAGDYPFEVEFEKEPRNNFSEDELELITDIAKESSFKLSSTNDFSVIISKSDTQEDINALWEYAASHGYSFYKHAGLESHQAGEGAYVFINFHHVHGGVTIYGEERDSFSVDNNSQLIPESNHYKLKEIINNKKEENMNEIERVIREGNMAMMMHKGVNTSTTSLPYTQDIKSTVTSLKKRAKRVGFVSTPLKSTI